ncbi:MAG: DUF521 domain-containing protein [Methanosarcinaceae archaeon]|nr:DUF521 domain-containing protein [Methanosarcinaceae archaeon]
MYLTKEEEKIYNGEEGETLQKAIEILVALGDIYGAEKFIPIKSAQISGVSYKTIGDAGLEWISDLKGTVKVPSILNPAGMDTENRKSLPIDDHFAEKQIEILNVFKNLGIRTQCTCTPYLLKDFDVKYKDNLAWGESSAISFANSVLGARTNREGGPSAISAALIGKTPNYGLHLEENRIPTILVETDFEMNLSDFAALGVVAGKEVGNEIPLFRMKDEKQNQICPKRDELKALGAAMAATGSVALYHIENITPEVLDKDFSFEIPKNKITIEKEQIDEIYEIVNLPSGKADNVDRRAFENVDLVTVGCPHCSEEELRRISELLDGKSVKKSFWIFTSRDVANRNPQIVESIEKSGAKVVCDTCMVVSPAANLYSKIMVNSGKAYAYVPGMCSAKSVFADLENCVKEALRE